MRARLLLNELLILILAVLILHLVALRFSLYWNVWWFDFAPHFLGGAWVGLFTVWLLRWSPYARYFSVPAFALLRVLTATLIVGVGWELFELVLGVAVSPELYALDTVLDISLDLGGAYVAVRYAHYRGYIRRARLSKQTI